MNNQSTLVKLVDDAQENDALFSDFHNNNQANRLKRNIRENLTISEGANHDKTKNNAIISRSPSFWNKFKKSKLGKCNIIMVVVNVLISLTLLSVFFFVQDPFNIFRKENKSVLLVKVGQTFGGKGGDRELNDAIRAALTFRDTIVTITGDNTLDLESKPLLHSFQFKYSNGKDGEKYGGEGEKSQSMGSESFTLGTNEHINHITIYTQFRKIDNAWVKDGNTELVVGIKFRTNHNRTKLFGSTDGHDKEEFFENYILGYPQGKAVSFVDKVSFTWYRYCSKSSLIA